MNYVATCSCIARWLPSSVVAVNCVGEWVFIKSKSVSTCSLTQLRVRGDVNSGVFIGLLAWLCAGPLARLLHRFIDRDYAAIPAT